MIAARLNTHRGYHAVQQVPGIGPILAAVFVAEIGDVHRQDRSSSLRCGRSVLTPALTRRCPHGGRKPTKPLVNDPLTEPRPLRDDKPAYISGSSLS